MSLIVFNKLDTIVRGKSVLKDISWAIEPHQNWVIVGPKGTGSIVSPTESNLYPEKPEGTGS